MDTVPSRPAAIRLAVAALMLCFAVGLAPLAASFVYEHPDEKYYTTAAIAMFRTGNWITPVAADGSPRLQKPGLAYWPIALSYRLFGVGVLQSRLPSLIAASLAIGLTWGVAYTVTARAPAALLAALMAFSQPHLILAATWATPDALLCLFLLLSAWGFLLLLADERPPRWAPWAAYGGAGLAIATKGLLSLLFVAFVWAFAWREDLRGAPVPRRRALVHLPAIAVGLGTAAWWYVALAREHGIGALEAFSRDQVVADTTLVWWAPSYHLVLYAIVLAASLLPWSGALTIAGLSRPGTATEWSRGRRFERFALVWSALVVLVFSFSVWVDGRFLLPAGPLLAVALAAALDRTHRAIRTRALTAILRVCLVGFSALVVLIGLLLLALHERRSAAALLIGAGALVAALALAAKRGLLAPAIAITAFAAFPLGALGLWRLSEPDAGVHLAARALSAGPIVPGSLLVMGPRALANQLLIMSGGRIRIHREPMGAWDRIRSDRKAWPEALILPTAAAARLDVSGCRTGEFAFGLGQLAIRPLLHAVWSGRAGPFLEAHRERYTVAVCS